METLLSLAQQSGIWAVMFVILFGVQLKDSKTREEKYQLTIDTLANKLNIINNVHSDVQTIIEQIDMLNEK